MGFFIGILEKKKIERITCFVKCGLNITAIYEQFVLSFFSGFKKKSTYLDFTEHLIPPLNFGTVFKTLE